MSFFATVVLPPPDGAEITISSGCVFLSLMRAGSFDVLRLFAELLQFGLERHHRAGDDAVVGLGTNGVHLAVHFLRQKIQRAAYRLAGIEAIVELLKMALEPGQ